MPRQTCFLCLVLEFHDFLVASVVIEVCIPMTRLIAGRTHSDRLYGAGAGQFIRPLIAFTCWTGLSWPVYVHHWLEPGLMRRLNIDAEPGQISATLAAIVHVLGRISIRTITIRPVTDVVAALSGG